MLEERYITKTTKRLNQLFGSTTTYGSRGWFSTRRVGKEETEEGKNLQLRKHKKNQYQVKYLQVKYFFTHLLTRSLQEVQKKILFIINII